MSVASRLAEIARLWGADFPMIMFAGDVLRYRGLQLPITKTTVLHNEAELNAYVRPYILLRSLKG